MKCVIITKVAADGVITALGWTLKNEPQFVHLLSESQNIQVKQKKSRGVNVFSPLDQGR